MCYGYTINLGNEIQSIAARRFLPKIDFYVDHEKLHLFKNSQKIKMIMNGWYLDCIESWPPSDDIDPLLISMHFNTSVNETKDVILTPESKDYFSTYGPVGCRDYSTLELLEENGIDSYYSGCLSLTLNSSHNDNDYKYVVVNSHNSPNIITYLKTKTDLPIYDIHQLTMRSYDKKYLSKPDSDLKFTSFYNVWEKFLMAENLISIYDNAQCIITDRFHAAMPALALETPVLFINDAEFGLERLNEISRLVRETTFEEYENDYSIFDVENPSKNPDDYLKIRKDLIKRTKQFTGYLDESPSVSFSENQIFDSIALMSRTCQESRRYMNAASRITKKYDKIIKDQQKIIDNQKREISELKSSKKKFKNPLKLFK